MAPAAAGMLAALSLPYSPSLQPCWHMQAPPSARHSIRTQPGLQEMLGIAEAMLASPLPEVVGYFREAFQRYSMLIAGSTEPRRAVHLATRAMMLAAVHAQQHRSFHEAHVCLMRAQLQVAPRHRCTGLTRSCSSVRPLDPGLQHQVARLQGPPRTRLGVVQLLLQLRKPSLQPRSAP